MRRWPGKTITYRESLPKKWDESLRLALDAWNSAGGKLRFVKAKGGAKPQLTIGYGPTQGYAGFATIGPAKNAYVHLSTGYKNADADLEQRLGVGRLLTHELGHVVGFGHVGKGCELMVTFIPATCLLLSFEPGYRVCRWIDKPLLKKFIAAYGGKGKLAPKFCPIDPLPPQLEDVAFTGGAAAGQPVRVTWKAQPADAGERVHIYVRAGACPASLPRATARTWRPSSAPRRAAGPTRTRTTRAASTASACASSTGPTAARRPSCACSPGMSSCPRRRPSATSSTTGRAGTSTRPGRPTPHWWPCVGSSTSPAARRRADEYATYLSVGGLYLEGTEDECIAFVSETTGGVRSARVTYVFDVP